MEAMVSYRAAMTRQKEWKVCRILQTTFKFHSQPTLVLPFFLPSLRNICSLDCSTTPPYTSFLFKQVLNVFVSVSSFLSFLPFYLPAFLAAFCTISYEQRAGSKGGIPLENYASQLVSLVFLYCRAWCFVFCQFTFKTQPGGRFATFSLIH